MSAPEQVPARARRTGVPGASDPVPDAVHAEVLVPGSLDEPTALEAVAAAPDLVEPDDGLGSDRALQVLRRGLAVSPELRASLRFTAATALLTAVGRITIPILIQQILDEGVTGDSGFRPGFVLGACALALVVVAVVAVLSRLTNVRMTEAAEAMLRSLRVKAFAHIHDLSLADHNEARRGVLTARVTSDIETIARFAQWGAIAWVVNPIVIVGVLAVLAVYSWQLALVCVVILGPLVPILRVLQRRQLRAYDEVRTRVGETLTAVSESVMGAGVIRAYGVGVPVRRRLRSASQEQYRAEVTAAAYFATMFPLADVFGGLALGAVVAAGAWWGPSWGLDVGALIACIFLVQLMLSPIAELGEVLNDTQTAIAGWRKVLDVLDLPVEVVEAVPGLDLPRGALSVRADHVGFAYRDGPPVLRDVSVAIPPGCAVAIVGETGSGKTTFAKLLCRLADPTAGSIRVGGVELREVAAAERHRAIRMVPQDGFLFDATVGENVRMGRPGASLDDVAEAFARLGLDGWLDGLADGLDTEVGERGENLSVGERQLVSLARAQLADPGLLVLDEATSAVDPETERALSTALVRLAEGRTTISIAHRLSTAESAELVLVFDDGRLVEEGRHDELVAAGGRYAALYAGWVGNTRRST